MPPSMSCKWYCGHAHEVAVLVGFADCLVSTNRWSRGKGNEIGLPPKEDVPAPLPGRPWLPVRRLGCQKAWGWETFSFTKNLVVDETLDLG